MPVRRVFREDGGVDATGAFLPAVARWIAARLVEPRDPDAAQPLLVMPGKRSLRRLRFLLAEALAAGGDGRIVAPPRVIEDRYLSESLLANAPRAAGPLASRLAWVRALQSLAEGPVHVLTARPPGAEELLGWSQPASQIEELDRELAAGGLSFRQVAEHCLTRDGFCDETLWLDLALIHDRYLQTLAECRLGDTQQNRRLALTGSLALRPCQVILIGCLDLNPLTIGLLEASGSSGWSLIDASPEDERFYDAFGSVQPSAWAERPLPLLDEQIRLVDRPQDQVDAALDALAGVGERSVGDITIGVGDEALLPVLERVLDLAGVPARAPEWRPAVESRPALLLSAAAAYLADPSLDNLHSLARHPDLEARFREAVAESGTGAPADTWLAALDRHAREHLHTRPGAVPDAPSSRVEGVIYRNVGNLLAPLRQGTRPLSEWAAAICGVLTEVYGDEMLDRKDLTHQRLRQALDSLVRLLRDFRALEQSPGLDLRCVGADVVRLLLERLEGVTIPNESGAPAIELLGWLELPLDDAPITIVTGLNEGYVPQSINGHAYLPDNLRRDLGLPDNARRYARDAAILSSLTRNAEKLTVIAGRRSAQGDPLTPSRLLFASDDETVVRRALQFYGQDTAAPARPARVLLKSGAQTTFRVPEPRVPTTPMAEFSVSAFKLYLACPYQFYLRYVCKLDNPDQRGLELDGGLFGELAHDVLKGFARSNERTSIETGAITERLMQQLAAAAGQRFGPDPSPAIGLQLEQLRRRLRTFANQQAARTNDGWIIQPEYIEEKLRATLFVADATTPVEVVGRIDRVDRHRDTGRYEIIDYKTGDSGEKPVAAHRASDGTWKDLQLPLYVLLARSAGLAPDSITTGYFNLPRDLSKVAYEQAQWKDGEITQGIEEAEKIARRVRKGHFPVKSKPGARYPSDYASITLDRCPGRKALLPSGATAAGR